VKQICPLLIPVTQSEIVDYNKTTRAEVDQEMIELKLRAVHAKLGLAFDMYPRNTAKFDAKDVIEMTAKTLVASQKLNNETLMCAKQVMNTLIDPKIQEKMK
jgi:hypothetical protein